MSFFSTQSVGGTETLLPGTSSVPPLKFQAGTLNSVALAGAVEFDGSALYSTAAPGARGVVAASMLAVLASSYTLTSQTAAQRLLNSSASGALTLAAGTYALECEFGLSSLSSASSSFGFALGGTASITQAWSALACKGTSQSAPTTTYATLNTAANAALTAASTGTTAYARIAGVIRVTVAGTLIPQVSLGATAAAVVSANSWFRATPLGSSGATLVGPWS